MSKDYIDPDEKINTGYVIKAETPLLRPGLSITTTPVSEKYAPATAEKVMSIVRAINNMG